MALELKVPEVGESITEVEIGRWLKNQGESFEKDEPLVEIETDKVTVELPAPASGTISKVLKQQGDAAEVGEVIGYVEEGEAGAARRTPPQRNRLSKRKRQPRQNNRPPIRSKVRKANKPRRPKRVNLKKRLSVKVIPASCLLLAVCSKSTTCGPKISKPPGRAVAS